jgi:hypothetical protein
LSVERYHELALQAAGITDAVLKRAGERLNEALDARGRFLVPEVDAEGRNVLDERGQPKLVMAPDWDARLRAIDLVLKAKGVMAPRGGTQGGGSTPVVINFPAWLAPGPRPVDATVIDVPAPALAEGSGLDDV